MRYLHLCAHEQFPPDQLLRQAVAAERAGFDGIGCSDHLQPWWEPGESGHAWPWLGAVAQATERAPVGEQIERMAEALEIIRELWDGERLSGRGRHFATEDAGREPGEIVLQVAFSWAGDDGTCEAMIVSSDPGADPLAAIATYAESVLPRLPGTG